MAIEKRLHALDYLRGLAAFAIMLYHYLGWSYGSFQADSAMGRLGVYGVAIFYILSGLTLFHVYYASMNIDLPAFREFFIKRFFRIFPLLWLITGISLYTTREQAGAWKIFLNFSGLFSILGWDEYIGTGVWSIGNELVFYLFFPLFIFLSRRKLSTFYLLSLMLLGAYVYFAFFRLKEAEALSSQWEHYINPLNQAFLFLGGYLIGLWTQSLKVPPALSILILLTAVFLFFIFPVEGNPIMLVTDVNRLFFTALCLLICFAVYKYNFQLPGMADYCLRTLGEISYSLYLLHPLVWFFTAMLFKTAPLAQLPPYGKVLAAVVLTLLLSRLVFERYERFFMQQARQLLQKPALTPAKPLA